MASWTPAAATARPLVTSLFAIALLASCAQPLTPAPSPPSTEPTSASTPIPSAIASFAGVSDPRGLAFDAAGNLWLTNGASGSLSPAGRILKLSASGATVDMLDLGVELGACAADARYLWTVSASPSARLWRIGLTDLATASFDLATGSNPVSPQGLVVDAERRVWLADAANDRVSIFQDGVRLRDVSVPRATESQGPTGLAVASDSIWIAAQGDRRVYQHKLSDYAPVGHVDLPRLATGVLGVDKNDLVWAGHAFFQGTNSVSKFADAGSVTKPYDVGQGEPVALTGDARGYVWAALRSNNQVARLTPATGGVVLYVSDAIARPRAIAVDAQGNAWVASQETVARIPAAP